MNVLIVEDDLSYALELEMLIDSIGYQVIAAVDNADNAFEIINQSPPDLILMDIDIKGKRTGIDIAKEIKPLKIPVIFITAFTDKDTYQKASETSPFGYVIKPFNDLTLRSIIEITIAKLYAESEGSAATDVNDWKGDLITEDSFFVKINRELRKIKFNNILYFQSDGNYTRIVTEGKKPIAKISLTKILEKLPAQQFIRIHKSFVVNLSVIQSINMSENELRINGHTISVGRKYKAELLSRLDTI